MTIKYAICIAVALGCMIAGHANATPELKPEADIVAPKAEVGPKAPAAATAPTRIEEARARVVEFALAELARKVVEPVGVVTDHRILQYFREGADWPKASYQNTKANAWCGVAVAYWWAQAGLKRDLRRRVLPSVLRLLGKGPLMHPDLMSWGRRRTIKTDAVAPGDLLIVNKNWHIALVVARSGDTVTTVEGNAVVDGFEGVVSKTYNLAQIDRVIRIQAEDLE